MKSATQTRAEMAEIEVAFQSMCLSHELSQAEKIIRHFLAHVNLCQGVLAAMKTLEPGKTIPQGIQDFILQNVGYLKHNHAKDLGIELKWEIPPAIGF